MANEQGGSRDTQQVHAALVIQGCWRAHQNSARSKKQVGSADAKQIETTRGNAAPPASAENGQQGAESAAVSKGRPAAERQRNVEEYFTGVQAANAFLEKAAAEATAGLQVDPQARDTGQPGSKHGAPLGASPQAEDKSSGYVTDVEDEARGGPKGDLQSHVSRSVTQESAVRRRGMNRLSESVRLSAASVKLSGSMQVPRSGKLKDAAYGMLYALDDIACAAAQARAKLDVFIAAADEIEDVAPTEAKTIVKLVEGQAGEQQSTADALTGREDMLGAKGKLNGALRTANSQEAEAAGGGMDEAATEVHLAGSGSESMDSPRLPERGFGISKEEIMTMEAGGQAAAATVRILDGVGRLLIFMAWALAMYGCIGIIWEYDEKAEHVVPPA
ncbi:hypothetical protein WJX75_003331 [Coccomyxa subellipsoidea]|uniref:Uncharacterized protein n=1 Tax=Coccomyxa subellipsoidea TaxID=248742 RepID=A0ABR2YKM5_9CHLO